MCMISGRVCGIGPDQPNSTPLSPAVSLSLCCYNTVSELTYVITEWLSGLYEEGEVEHINFGVDMETEV